MRARVQLNSNPSLLLVAQPLETPAAVDITILLVETDPDTLTILDEIVFDLGCFVDVHSSGQEALEYLRQNTPNLAILSADLPDPGGIDVCFRAKRIRRLQNMPVMILSNNDDDKTRDFAQMAKADVFLPKPLEPELFKAALAELATRAQKMTEENLTDETVILEF